MRNAIQCLLMSSLLLGCGPREDHGPTKRVLVKRERLAIAIDALTAAGHERVEAGT